jgi:hypothetical protein
MTDYYKNSEGKRCSRVTSVIKKLGFNTEMIVAWAKREGTKANEISETAFEIGNFVHATLEALCYGTNVSEELSKTATFEATLAAARATKEFNNFLEGTNATIIESEYVIIDNINNIGGTVDIILNIPQDITYKGTTYKSDNYLADFKTSKAVYREHIIQMAGYKDIIRGIGNLDNKTIKQICKHNEHMKHTQFMTLNSYELNPGAILFAIDKTFKEEKDPFKAVYVPEKYMQYALREWHIAVQLHENRNVFNGFLKEINEQ